MIDLDMIFHVVVSIYQLRPIHIINLVDKVKFSCNTPHRRSTTVSVEDYPLYT